MFKLLFEHLEKYQLYRRLIVAYAGVLVLYATIESFRYANAALSVGDANINTAAIIAAIQIPITWFTGFVSKLYWQGKTSNEQ